MKTQLFLTFNPNEAAEQNTALRMQTISNLYGLSTELPARAGISQQAKNLSPETQQRIQRAEVVVAICLHRMSNTLRQELTFAIAQQKPIVVLYDQLKGKTIDFGEYKNYKEIHVDFNQTDQALHEIAVFLRGLSPESTPQQSSKSNQDGTGILLGLLGVGIGLLTLWAISDSKR